MTWIILIGSFIVDILILILLIFNFTTLEHLYLTGRIIATLGTLIYLCIVGFFLHKKYIRIGAWMLLVLYAVIGMLILHIWGINAPIGILIFSFAIVLAGVMLGARYIMIVTAAIIILLVVLQHFSVMGINQPDRSMLDDTSTYMDVMNYSIFFCIFALVSWLSGSRMESTLKRAVYAESALKKERDMLADRVEEQTKRLIDAQHKELKQLYKFAELGQLTTIILHELANYLNILTLDIDDLKERHHNSIAIDHAKESIFYIDTIIDQVRNQINDSDDTKRFDVLINIKDCLDQLRKKISDSNIKLFIEDNRPKNYLIFGDPLRLSQALTILVTNATQANKNRESEISVELSSTKSKIIISVKDFGTGITPEARRTLFHPQKSKKGAGLGIGLYVTKQIIETHFKGKIWLSPAIEYTQFTLEIPRLKTELLVL
jgi:signal transduction histidine kinase